MVQIHSPRPIILQSFTGMQIVVECLVAHQEVGHTLIRAWHPNGSFSQLAAGVLLSSILAVAGFGYFLYGQHLLVGKPVELIHFHHHRVLPGV